MKINYQPKSISFPEDILRDLPGEFPKRWEEELEFKDDPERRRTIVLDPDTGEEIAYFTYQELDDPTRSLMPTLMFRLGKAAARVDPPVKDLRLHYTKVFEE